jgi:hypothetical protein
MQKQKAGLHRLSDHDINYQIGRGERIRTSGLYVPNVALYQAKLHPVFVAFSAERSIPAFDRENA